MANITVAFPARCRLSKPAPGAHDKKAKRHHTPKMAILLIVLIEYILFIVLIEYKLFIVLIECILFIVLIEYILLVVLIESKTNQWGGVSGQIYEQ